MAAFLGTTGNHSYTGTTAADTIHHGNGGDDSLSGNGGNDQITVTGGVDNVSGDAGTDTLIIHWEDLANRAYNNGGPNGNGVSGGWDGQFYADDGRRVTYGAIENFHIYTGSADDSITTAGGHDIVSTGAGDDIVNVGSGTNTADGCRNRGDKLEPWQ